MTITYITIIDDYLNQKFDMIHNLIIAFIYYK